MPRPAVATVGPVRVVGTGLLGASLGLALSAAGVDVQLEDASPSAVALGRDMGAGRPATPDSPAPRLVVVATPPDVAGPTVLAQLRAHPGAVVTDVASVKARVAHHVERHGGDDAARYVGSHPMAGRERSGAAAADADLFVGRPWVIVPGPRSTPDAVLAVRSLAVDVGAAPTTLGAQEHDDAVALVSHLPQLAASMVAARLRDAPETALGLAGQGLRDVTRIAASDPQLWAAILVGNAGPVARALRALREDVDTALAALERAAADGPLTEGAAGPLARVVAAGNTGVARIPGKHGGAPRRYAEVSVLVPDQPGELGRLFGEVGEAGVNIEDLHLEHSAGQPVGLAILSVDPAAASRLEAELDRRGWRLVASGRAEA
ncbi:prephenate dehydrogenase [Georgenia thermotolerans]|uniref:Prephenate dehydrogenase n=1 Tax=Georgenia thermotolerans TaxID=527326 RepID=A0A7J5UUA8_9MICO|nr:prephenate dehydrogenase [Georgenia thermotolerans]KAE8765871.1 prephenate dehydrogenase [Georgenia thermotolerans]